jgi:SNF2 family DNA or RNA helicase
VQALQARKAALVDAVIDDGDLFGSTLTADEVRELLA